MLADKSIDEVGVRERNYLAGAKFPDGPVTRISGINLVVDISYYNEETEPEKIWGRGSCPQSEERLRPGVGKGPWAIIHIRTDHGWNTRQRFFPFDSLGSFRFRYYSGITV